MNSKINDDLISIIIINYNGLDYILNCIESIFQVSDCNYEVILIDNDSSDNSSDICKEKFPQIRLFKNKKNLAMAARNVGIDNAKGKYILFLDADTILLPNSISTLFQSYLQHGKGLYQGKLLARDDHNKIETCGNFTNIFGFGYGRGRGRSDEKQYDKFEETSFTVGACTFSTTEIIKSIGYIDQSSLFFLMLDDLDYGWRAWLKNIPCYYEPNCILYHVGSPTLKWSAKKFFYAEQNRWICLLSNYSANSLLKILPLLLIVDLGTLWFLSKKGLTISKIKSSISVLSKLGIILQNRSKVQKTRMVSDSMIITHFVDNIELPSMVSKDPSNNLLLMLSKFARRLIC